ncbi:IS1182 family transposase [Fundidesulfovibrio putealis]|uniref:IS1182 family transposase n=1 Tax=Fundidesulfovibrio putealis TaxID=270496 RepID=UPI00041DD2D5|nr:IS1182 family transposase [Fundidesulfovibrio putealis]
MPYNFRKFDPHQLLLLPPNLDDWLPQQHLARFLADVVSNLDLKPLLRRYRPSGQGGAAFSPEMMLRVLLYAYCVGVPSSRKIAQALIDDVAFRWLAAGNRPDFRTIATFRRQHLKCLKPLFLQVLLLCKQAGLVKVGIVALDGTKVAANAALDRNRTWEKLTAKEQALLAEVESMLKRAESTDRDEDARFGDDSGDGLPKVSTAHERLALIRRAKAELEAQAREAAREQEDALKEREREEKESGKSKRGRKPKPVSAEVEAEAKANLTDPESRIMKTRKGYVQGYNAQATVSEDQIIVACDVVQDCNDFAQLKPMVELAEANLYEIGEEPGKLLADAGYCSENNLEYMARPGAPDPYVAVKKDHKQRGDDESAPRGRMPKNLTQRQRMERKLRTKAGKALYKLRGQIVEAVFGQIKDCRKLTRFLLRGLDKVKGEFELWSLTHNLLKLYRHGATSG